MKDYQIESLQLVKKSILEEFFLDSTKWYIPKNDLLKKSWACFVTIKNSDKSLRWCIWSIVPYRDLYKDIISNAKSASFNDLRFEELKQEELKDLYLEITILSPLKDKKFESIEDLLSYLKENKPWLIIKFWSKQATFLPSVWKEVPNEQSFLYHLLFKAWISDKEFVKNFDKVEFQVYTWEEFWEEFSRI